MGGKIKMSFNIEKLITIELYCPKCERKLSHIIPHDAGEIYIGGSLFGCLKCGMRVVVMEKK